MVLWLLAHKERRDRLAVGLADSGDRSGDRDRAHLQATDEVGVEVTNGIQNECCNKMGALRIQHRWLHIEVVRRRTSRGQRHLLARLKRAGLDNFDEPVAPARGIFQC